jgi:trimeric autotransporter adhesin
MVKIATLKCRQALNLSIAAAFIFSGLLMLQGNIPVSVEGENEETENPAAALKQEFKKMRDPALNMIPSERMLDAIEYYSAAKSNFKTTTTFSNIIWTERGPSNIGGRTRTLLFDKNDATYKTVFAAGVGGGLWKCTDITLSTPVWTCVNDQFSNLAITSIAQDPTNNLIMYFGTGEGFNNADAIKGNGIWKSTNGGTTWTQLSSTNNNDNFSYVQKLIVTSAGHLYAACKGYSSGSAGGLQKSTDGGATWTRVIGNTGTSTDLRVTDVEEAANGDLYASVGIFNTGKVYKSSSATYGVNVGNSGNWSNITPAGSYWRIELAVAPGNANQVYAICEGSGSYEVSDIFSSSNGGTNWTARTVPTIYDQGSYPYFTRDQAWYDIAAAVDPNNSSTLYIGGVDMLKSTNEGISWTQLTSWSLYNDGSIVPFPWSSAQNVHADMHIIAFKPGSSTTALLGCDGGVYYSSNLTVGTGLPTWASKNSGYKVTQYYSCAAHPTNTNYFLAGAQDNGSHKFTAAGVNTGNQVTGGDGAFCFIDQNNANNQITSYVYNYFFISTNGGSSFNDIDAGDGTGGFINPCDLDNTNDILYAAGDANDLVRWTNVFGISTRSDFTFSLGGASISAVKVSPNNASTVYVGTDNGRVYRVTNANGASPTASLITSSALGSSGNVSSIDVVKRTTNTDDSILVTLSNYGINSVYLTYNGTVSSPTWNDIDDNSTLQDIPVRWGMFSPTNSKIIFLATEVGVLGTNNLTGSTTAWTLINNSSLPNVRVDMLKTNSNGELVAATHGRGLWTSLSITPLALKLISFDARLINNSNISLSWEVNNDNEARMYIVERSYDGINFEDAGRFSPEQKAYYSKNDRNFSSTQENIYYRLSCEDLKGNIKYSAIQTVHINMTGNFIENIFPTITSNTLTIKTGSVEVKQMNVQLIDAVGHIYLNKNLPYNSTTINMDEYPAGNYIVLINSMDGKHSYTGRIVKR